MNDILTGFDYSPPPASRTKRWIASVIDYFIYFSIIALNNYMFGDPVTNAHGDIQWELHGPTGFWAILLPWLFFFPVVERFNNGQTIGKAIFRIRTVREGFHNLDLISALIRHLCDILDFLPCFGIIGLLITTSRKYKQRIGDLVAKTIVIDANYKPQEYTHRKTYK